MCMDLIWKRYNHLIFLKTIVAGVTSSRLPARCGFFPGRSRRDFHLCPCCSAVGLTRSCSRFGSFSFSPKRRPSPIIEFLVVSGLQNLVMSPCCRCIVPSIPQRHAPPWYDRHGLCCLPFSCLHWGSCLLALLRAFSS